MAEMAKVGIKNVIKLIKKCISEQMDHVSNLLNEILDHLISNFEQIRDKTVDYLY